MKRQRMHTDWALLLRGHFPKRANLILCADIGFASSLIQNALDALALNFMLLPVFVLTFFVAIPNALAGPALLQLP